MTSTTGAKPRTADANDALGPEDEAELRASIAGDVFVPRGSGYDQAREIWNAMIDKRPAAVVRCAADGDVVSSLAFARDRGLAIAVRGGGHSVAGQSTCEGGLVIDLGALNDVRIDRDNKLAFAGGGSLLGDLDRATQAHRLVTPAGVVSHTGVGGLTLGGGVGWLTRAYGLSCDNIEAARVVLASGEIVTASEADAPDLLWGLQGGGGNFGVVTEFTLRCHEFGPTLPVALAFWELDDAPRVLRAYRDLVPEQPNEWKATPVLLPAPPAVGRPLIGHPCLMILQIWATGDSEAARDAFRPLVEAARPEAYELSDMSYLDLQQIQDEDCAPGNANYTKGGYLSEISDQVIEALVESVRNLPSAGSGIEVIPHGGAQLDRHEDSTAFPDRAAAYSFNVFSRWPLDASDELCMDWARRSYDRLVPHQSGGVYTNFFSVDDEDQAHVLAAYGESKYRRLAELKRRYDPDNVFALNANIRPA